MNAVTMSLVIWLIGGVAAFSVAAVRWPSALLALALSSYAIAVEAFVTETYQERELAQIAGLDTGPLQKSLILASLTVYAIHHGIRLRINWPIVVVGVILALNFLFSDLYRNLTTIQMFRSAFSLAFPWCAANMVFTRDTRKLLGIIVPVIPVISAVVGLVLQVVLWDTSPEGDRFGGASISAYLSYMSFAGFAVALHESLRRKQAAFIYLAFLNAALLILAGGRMGILASMVMLAIYSVLSKQLRQSLGSHAIGFIIGGLGIAVILLIYLPFLQQRMAGGGDIEVPMTNRDVLWGFFWQEFLVSPIFGRGIGTGAVAALDANLPARAVHNEYLRILVEGGMVGFLMYFGAVGVWFRRLIAAVGEGDRCFILAAIGGLAVYALTDNILVSGAVVPFYIYLGALFSSRAGALKHRPKGRRQKIASVGGSEQQHER